jgi:hypothetical protein
VRWFLRKWMIVAFPLDPSDEVSISAAKQWNKVYMGERLNRYFTMTAAEMDAEQHGFMWSRWIRFEVVDRQQFHEGWE